MAPGAQTSRERPLPIHRRFRFARQADADLRAGRRKPRPLARVAHAASDRGSCRRRSPTAGGRKGRLANAPFPSHGSLQSTAPGDRFLSGGGARRADQVRRDDKFDESRSGRFTCGRQRRPEALAHARPCRTLVHGVPRRSDQTGFDGSPRPMPGLESAPFAKISSSEIQQRPGRACRKMWIANGWQRAHETTRA